MTRLLSREVYNSLALSHGAEPEFMLHGLRWVMTCVACPEQYDIFDEGGAQVGYFRFRSGRLTLESPDCGDTCVWSNVHDDLWRGMFASYDDALSYLTDATEALLEHLSAVTS